MDYESPKLWDIHGEICSEDMRRVQEVIADPAWCTRIYESGFDGHLELTIEAAGLFELEYGGGPDDGGYLFGGCIDTGQASAVTLFRSVSEKLAAAGFRHRFECYEGDRLVLYLHHDWPQIG